jgi:hypothetical protein
VFLHERLGAPLGSAALGYAAFTACQTSLRLAGDRLRRRTTATRLVRVGTAIAAAGLTIVVLSPWTAVAVAGFAVTGVGLALPLPVLFGVVGHLGADGAGREGDAAAMLARFTTMTYTGILLAPAVIGWIIGAVGLPDTLAGLVPLLAAVAWAAGIATGTELLQWGIWRIRTTSRVSSPPRIAAAPTRRRSPSFATGRRSGTGCGSSSPRSPASV